MPKVYIGCFGSGLGHASRMLGVAASLVDAGAEVLFSSSDEAARLIGGAGHRCNVLPRVDVVYDERGRFSATETIVTGPYIIARTMRQAAAEVDNVKRFRPDVVLTDSALSTLLAAKALRLPAAAVLNQLEIGYRDGGGSLISRAASVWASGWAGTMWGLSDAVLLPDLPPPYTISERNLWRSGVPRTRYIGFLGATTPEEPDEAALSFAADPRPKVFWQVSGPSRTRPAFLAAALNCAAKLSDRYAFVVSAGEPGALAGPARTAWGWYYGWCPVAGYYFRACDVVVSRAGHTTVGKAVSCGKPSLLVPIPLQPEQEENASKAARLGVSRVLSQDDLHPGVVGEALRDLLSGSYAQRAVRLGKWAMTFDARKEVVRTALSLADRNRRPDAAHAVASRF